MDGIFFLLLALLTIITSVKLSFYADLMNKQTKIKSLIIGGIVLAGITSLPEFVTCMSGIIIKNPNLSIGDILGSNLFNILIIATFDILILKRRFTLYFNKNFKYIIFILIIINISIIKTIKMNITIFNIGLPTIVSIIGYFLFLILITKIKIKEEEEISKNEKYLKTKFIITSIIMIILSIMLTLKADYIACNYPNFKSSTIGAFLLGITTSLPEVVSFYTLIRLSNYNLAFSNIVGSNIFNFLILSICDIFTSKSLYSYSEYENLNFIYCGLISTILLLIYTVRKKSNSRILYLIPSIIIFILYIILWCLQFI